VVPGSRVVPLDEALGERGVLLALAATAYHVLAAGAGRAPELIVGHGVLGRLLARLAKALHPSTQTLVWESNPDRMTGAEGYQVLSPMEDARRNYGVICDVSGDPGVLDDLIARLAPGGEIFLAGFYSDRLSFAFPPAFMREASIRIAAEWKEPDLLAVKDLLESGRLSLDGLITHRCAAEEADTAYRTAFGDPSCLKMILDWRGIE
jgi:3-hydroxyethyl bacteriochlorophyllide a dehydrogenase